MQEKKSVWVSNKYLNLLLEQNEERINQKNGVSHKINQFIEMHFFNLSARTNNSEPAAKKSKRIKQKSYTIVNSIDQVEYSIALVVVYIAKLFIIKQQ